MTIQYLPFDSVAGDRIVSSELFAQMTNKIGTDGIIAFEDDLPGALKVIPSSPASLIVKVQPGASWVQGRFMEITVSNESLTITPPPVGFERTDRIVVRLDYVNRNMTVQVKQGVQAAANSNPPSLQRDTNIWELSLAKIKTFNATTQITASMIIDERFDGTVCGISIPTSLKQGFSTINNINGWFRIAQNGSVSNGAADGTNVHAIISIRSSLSGVNSAATFLVTTQSGLMPTIVLLGRSEEGNSALISAVRLLTNGSADGCAFEVFLNSTGNNAKVSFDIWDNFADKGLYPINFVPGSVPATFNETILNFNTFAGGINMVTGMATDNGNNTVSVARDGTRLPAPIPPVPVSSSARVTHSVAQTMTTGVLLILAFNTERFDTDGYHDNAINNSRLTAPFTGKYLIGANVSWGYFNDGLRVLNIRRNGSTIIASTNLDHITTFNGSASELTTFAQLTAGDYLEVTSLQSSGANVDVLKLNERSPEFWITFMGT